MSRTFHHNLNISFPCSFCQLSQSYQFLYLTSVCCVCKTARATRISKAYGHVILSADFYNLIVVLVERILISGHGHPCEYEASSTADYVHLSTAVSNLFYCLSRNATVECDKVYTVLRMKSYDLNEVPSCKCAKVSLVVNHRVVYRNCSYHSRALIAQLLSKWLRVSVARKIHDCLCT